MMRVSYSHVMSCWVFTSCRFVQVAPGMLITFLQKGLAYVGIEEHLNEVRKTTTFCSCFHTSAIDAAIRAAYVWYEYTMTIHHILYNTPFKVHLQLALGMEWIHVTPSLVYCASLQGRVSLWLLFDPRGLEGFRFRSECYTRVSYCCDVLRPDCRIVSYTVGGREVS